MAGFGSSLQPAARSRGCGRARLGDVDPAASVSPCWLRLEGEGAPWGRIHPSDARTSRAVCGLRATRANVGAEPRDGSQCASSEKPRAVRT